MEDTDATIVDVKDPVNVASSSIPEVTSHSDGDTVGDKILSAIRSSISAFEKSLEHDKKLELHGRRVKTFAGIDETGSKTLDLSEFKVGAKLANERKLGFTLSDAECDSIFARYYKISSVNFLTL